MFPDGTKDRSATKDHILPRSRREFHGGNVVMHIIVCYHCNNLRATCGHCWGAVACVRAVAVKRPENGSRAPEFHVAAAWGMARIGIAAEPQRKAGRPAAMGSHHKSLKFAAELHAADRRPTLADVWPVR